MIVCITSAGPGLDSEMDPRFGRCPYFLFVDPQSLEVEAVGNPNAGASGGAGIQAAQFVASKGAKAVITGQVGPNACTALQAAGIDILAGASGKARDLLERYKSGRLPSHAQGPTVQAHAGMGMGRGMGRGVSPSRPAPGPSGAPGEDLRALKEESQKIKGRRAAIEGKIARLGGKK